MLATPQNLQYFAFLRWFQTTYPDMYAKYWKNVQIPIDGEKIRITTPRIDPKDFETLLKQLEKFDL